MNESSKSSPLLTKLRIMAHGSVVFKHADRATIGIPDASMTWRKDTTWMEFKLLRPPKRWDGTIDFEAIAQKHPVQYETAKRLARENKCFYVVWVARRNTIGIWNPLTKESVYCTDTDEVTKAIMNLHQRRD